MFERSSLIVKSMMCESVWLASKEASASVGAALGDVLGDSLGDALGDALDGLAVGDALGSALGIALGVTVSGVGAADGEREGTAVEGDEVGVKLGPSRSASCAAYSEPIASVAERLSA